MSGILPTFTLTGPGGTVNFSRKQGPEELAFPTEAVPTEVRRCLASDDDPGRVYLLTGPWQKAGQTLATSHRIIDAASHALLKAWNRSRAQLTYTDETGSFPVAVLNYDARPRNVRFRWASQVVVNELKLLFVEED